MDVLAARVSRNADHAVGDATTDVTPRQNAVRKMLPTFSALQTLSSTMIGGLASTSARGTLTYEMADVCWEDFHELFVRQMRIIHESTNTGEHVWCTET